jgi:tetratricopeptide (TPR) repeat protein
MAKMLRPTFLFFSVIIGIFAIVGSIQAFPQQESAKSAMEKLNRQNDSLSVQLANLSKRTESLEMQNNLLIKAMESQLNETERKSRFLEMTLAGLGGLLGILIAIITFASLWQGRWERKFHEKREIWERDIQDKREGREGKVVDALKENVETVTNLMQIISEGQKVATFVKKAIERQNLQSKSFRDEISTVNAKAEKMLKEGKLKRREVRQREVQGEIHVLGNLINEKLMLLPLIPFDIGDEKFSATALYVRALQLFLDGNYTEANKFFKDARHLVQSGDLLWQIPYYEGMVAKNEGNYPAAISAFEEAITARAKADPELGSQTEIAETIYLRGTRRKNQEERQRDIRDVRDRCLKIILRAEGSEQSAEVSLSEIEVGKNPEMTDEFRRLQAQCFLIVGNSYWLEEDFQAALLMYKKSIQFRQTSVYAFSSVGQALDKLNSNNNSSEDPLPYYEKAFYTLHGFLGRHDEAQNRILRSAVFGLCVKKLRSANKIEGSWEPIRYRIEAERIVEDELRFKNRNIKLFSPFSKIPMDQAEFVDELQKKIG